MTQHTKDPVAAVAALDSEIAGLQEQDRTHTHYRGLLGRMTDEKLMCSRCKRLPREFGELCEPCWEIGRDEPLDGGDV